MKRSLIAVLAAMAAMMFSAATVAQTESVTAPTGTALPAKKQARRANWQVEKAVRKALSSAKHLDSSGIMVVARDHQITRDGSVPSEDQIQIALDVARREESGKTIVNNLIPREAGH